MCAKPVGLKKAVAMLTWSGFSVGSPTWVNEIRLVEPNRLGVTLQEVTPEDAAKGLQHCANVIRDDVFGFPGEDRYESVKALIKAAVGKSPGSYKSKMTVPLNGNGKGTVVEQVSVIMGVYLDLNRNRQLVSISIDPKEVRKRREVMKFVGASTDEPDVALRHDDYLAMQDPHGRF